MRARSSPSEIFAMEAVTKKDDEGNVYEWTIRNGSQKVVGEEYEDAAVDDRSESPRVLQCVQSLILEMGLIIESTDNGAIARQYAMEILINEIRVMDWDGVDLVIRRVKAIKLFLTKQRFRESAAPKSYYDLRIVVSHIFATLSGILYSRQRLKRSSFVRQVLRRLEPWINCAVQKAFFYPPNRRATTK